MTNILLVLALLFPAQPSPAKFAGKDKASLEKMATAIEQNIAKIPQSKGALRPGPGGFSQSPAAMARMLLSQFRTGIAENDPAQMESALSGLSSLVDSDPLRKECLALTAQMSEVRVAQEKKAAEEIHTLLENAAPTVAAAKKASDLDALLADITRMESQGRNLSSAPRLEGIHQYAKLWQDYLSCSAFGNGRGVREALQQLSNANGNLPDLIPRSEILARLQAMANPIVVRDDEPDQGGEPAGKTTTETKHQEGDTSQEQALPEPKVFELESHPNIHHAFEPLSSLPLALPSWASLPLRFLLESRVERIRMITIKANRGINCLYRNASDAVEETWN